MKKEIKDKILKIVELSIEMTEAGNDCFVDYSGHVSLVNVHWYRGRRKNQKLYSRWHEFYIDNELVSETIEADMDSIIEEMKEVIKNAKDS